MPEPETRFIVRDIGRLPLGTKHTTGAYKIAEILHRLKIADPHGSLQFLLDVTGIGEGIADMIEGYLPTQVKMIRCQFVGSERLTRQGRSWSVGKAHLVSRLSSLLETGRVKLPDTPQARALTEELRDFEYRVTPSANLVAEARTGAHDDLVTALGLATLIDGGARPSWARPSPTVDKNHPLSGWGATLGV